MHCTPVSGQGERGGVQNHPDEVLEDFHLGEQITVNQYSLNKKTLSWIMSLHATPFHHTVMCRARTAQLEEHQARDQKVVALIPGSSGGGIFFSRVNFLH